MNPTQKEIIIPKRVLKSVNLWHGKVTTNQFLRLRDKISQIMAQELETFQKANKVYKFELEAANAKAGFDFSDTNTFLYVLADEICSLVEKNIICKAKVVLRAYQRIVVPGTIQEPFAGKIERDIIYNFNQFSDEFRLERFTFWINGKSEVSMVCNVSNEKLPKIIARAILNHCKIYVEELSRDVEFVDFLINGIFLPCSKEPVAQQLEA